MPVIVNAYKNDTSLGDTLASLGEHLFGKDAAQGELLRQKSHGLRRDNEALDYLQRKAATNEGVDANDPGTRAAIFGAATPNEVGQAMRITAGNRYGADSKQVVDANAGLGGSYASTVPGYREGQANEMTRAKMQADTAAAAAMRLAEATPTNVVVDGKPTVMSRAQAIRGGHMPVLSHSDQQGVLLGNNFNNLETLPPQQQHAVGAFVPVRQTQAGFDAEEANKARTAELQAEKTRMAAQYAADVKPINTYNDRGEPEVTRQSESFGRRPVLGAAEEQGVLRQRGFPTGYAGQNPSQLVASGAQPSAEHLYNWTDTGPNGEVLQGRTNDGRTDLTTGKPLSANARVQGVNNASAVKDQLVPTNTNLTHIQEKHANNADLRGLIQHATQLIDSDPFATGATGKAVDWSQRANLAAAQMGAFLGRGKDWKSGLENVKMEAASKLGPAAEHLFPDIYNPVPDQLNALYGMLTYKTAQALFGQEGRGLNIEDVRRTQEILGNAGNWLTNPQELKARLAMVDRYAQQNMANASAKINQHNALTQGASVGGQPAPTVAPGATEEWGRGPDGRPVRLR